MRRVHLGAVLLLTAAAVGLVLLPGAVVGWRVAALSPAAAANQLNLFGGGSVVECRSNLQQIARGATMWCEDNDERMPKGLGFAEVGKLIQPYLIRSARERLLKCPITGKPYAFNTALSGVSVKSIKKPAETPMFRDSVPHA